MRSFEGTRERRAPRRYRGTTLHGDVVEGEFTTRTLVLAVKDDCLGCESVVASSAQAFGEVATLVVAARPSADPAWATSAHQLLVSESLLADLDVRWPPFYVLVDPRDERVVCEGVVFAPAQVREEIAPYLT